jgi:hypothetical protein
VHAWKKRWYTVPDFRSVATEMKSPARGSGRKPLARFAYKIKPDLGQA